MCTLHFVRILGLVTRFALRFPTQIKYSAVKNGLFNIHLSVCRALKRGWKCIESSEAIKDELECMRPIYFHIGKTMTFY